MALRKKKKSLENHQPLKLQGGVTCPWRDEAGVGVGTSGLSQTAPSNYIKNKFIDILSPLGRTEGVELWRSETATGGRRLNLHQ